MLRLLLIVTLSFVLSYQMLLGLEVQHCCFKLFPKYFQPKLKQKTPVKI